MSEVNLPEEWRVLKFDDVILNVNGARKPISLKERENIKGEYPYYGATGKIDSLNSFTHEGEHVLIGEDGANLLSRSKNLAFIVNGQFWVNNHAHAVRCLAGMPAKYVASYINSLNLAPWVTGSAQPKLTKGNLARIPTPFPPLAEQKVIADKLDSMLAQVETTKARLDRIPEILKTFRQSVLASAVSGKLTGGKVKPIGKLKDCALIVSGLAFKKSEYSESGSRLLQIANVGYGKTKWDNPNYIPIKLSESCPEYSMKVGDLVLALNRPITNDTLKIARLEKNDLPSTLYQRVARIRCDQKMLEADYLFLVMQSPTFLKLVEMNLKGSDQPYLNTSDLASFDLYAPSLKEQTESVRRVEELFAFADSVEEKANAALERVNKLTQSILAKAFRGELTADWRAGHPDLISGENSAEALLERIKAEREALSSKKKPKVKTSARKKA